MGWVILAALLSSAEIVVGENVRVSLEEVPYVEPYVAAHPLRRGHLLAAATRFTGGKPAAPVAFVSSDGGATWSETLLPLDGVEHAVDVWLAFSESGTAYASFLVIERGQSKTKIVVFRSGDGGRTWTRVSTIAGERSFDRPAMIARGREVVITAESGGGIALLHSRDRGETFGTPRRLRPARNLEHNSMNPLWRGSALVVPYVDFGSTLAGSRIAVVETRDGGRTWSAPAVVADIPRRLPGNAHFAAAGDAIYAAFASGTAEQRTISVTASFDGVVWTEPVHVSHSGKQSFRPSIAVAENGDVGVTWIEAGEGCTRLWFAVSRDRGRTFSAPVAVSDEFSCADTPPNREAVQRWEHGGDYFGLTASERNAFVAVWPDARLGTFQIYAARIDVR